MKKWVSTLLSILLLLNNFVTPISAIAEAGVGEQTPVVDIFGGADNAIPDETEPDAADKADGAPDVVLINGIDLIDEEDDGEPVANTDEVTGNEPGEEDGDDASNYSAFISGYAYTAASCDVYDTYDLAAEELAAHVMGTLEAGQLVYAIDRYGDGTSDDEWMRIAFAVEQDGQIDFAQVYIPASSLNAVAAEELDALKAELAAAGNAASFDGTLLTPAAFTLKAVEQADTQETEEEPEEDVAGDAPAPLPPVATVYEFACGLEAHTHTADCYNEAGEPTCGLVEHVHDASCLAAAQYDQPEEQADYHWSTDSEEQPEETQPEETAEPITELSTRYGDSLITLTADPGVIPDGAELVVSPVDSAYVIMRIYESVPSGMELESVKAYDIKLLVDGEEVEPSDDVHVEITNAIAAVSLFSADVSKKQTVVYHISDAGAIPVTGLRDVTSTIRFEAPHFSIYAVAVFSRPAAPGEPTYDENGLASVEPLTDTYKTKTKNGEITIKVPEYGGEDGKTIVGWKDQTVDLNSPAFDFHIFAWDATVNAHTNGNIAAGQLHAETGMNFGNKQSNAAGDGQEIYVAELLDGEVNGIEKGSRLVIGSTVKFWKKNEDGSEILVGTKKLTVRKNEEGVDELGYYEGDEWVKVENFDEYKGALTVSEGTVYQEQTTDANNEPIDDRYIDIKGELDSLAQQSELLATAQQTADVTVDFSDSEHVKLDTTTQGDNSTVVVYIDASKFDTNAAKYNFEITTKPGQTVIINVDVTNKTDLSQLQSKLNGIANTEETVFADCNVIWNFYTKDSDGKVHAATGDLKIGNGEGLHGVMLAPKANVTYGAINGIVIGQSTHQDRKESHQMFFHTGTSIKFTVSKTLTSEYDDSPKTFYFALFSDPEGKNRVSWIKSVTVKPDDHAETVAFQDIDIPEGVTYYVFETDSEGRPIGNDSRYKVTPDYAALDAETTSASFNNTDQGKPKYAPEVRKEYDGGDAREFKFTLTPIGDAPGGAQTLTMSYPAGKFNYTAKFQAIEFEKQGTYQYEIREVPGKDGIVYDSGVWTLTIVVKEIKANVFDIDKSTITYSKSGGITVYDNKKATFINTETVFRPKVEKKAVLNSDESLSPDEETVSGTFQFTLGYDGDGYGDKVILPDTKLQLTWPDEKEKLFGAIKFTEPGEYRFTITEDTLGDDGDWITDTAKWYLVVKVGTDSIGRLVVTDDSYFTYYYKDSYAWGPDRKTEATFTNKYKPTDDRARFVPNVEKKVVSADDSSIPADFSATFKFTMELEKADPSDAYSSVKMPDNTKASVTWKSGETNVSPFDAVTFTKEGTYTFKITEDSEDKVANVDYTTDEQRIVVKVEKRDGKLVATTTDDTTATVTFTNTYKEQKAEFAPQVKKVVEDKTGGTLPNEKREFTFQLKDNETSKVLGTATVTVAAGATESSLASFDLNEDVAKELGLTVEGNKIVFTEANAGEQHTYTIHEVVPESVPAGWTYAEDQTFTVAVTMSDGKLSVKPSSKDALFTFTNTYDKASYELKVEKKVEGEGADPNKEFTFTLTGGDLKEPYPTVTLKAGQTRTFGSFEYTGDVPKDIKYTINETVVPKDEEDGWTFAVSQEVTVHVDKDGTGKLYASVTYAEPNKTGDAALFTNKYDHGDASFAPEVHKTITSQTGAKVPDGVTFTFTLTQNATGAPTVLTGEQTVTISSTDVNREPTTTATFAGVTFKEKGTYEFTIKESVPALAQDGKLDGWTYDTSVWTVTVKVGIDGGKLKVTNTTYEKSDAAVAGVSMAEFVNDYSTDKASAKFPYKKTLLGRNFKDGDSFTFTVTAKEGTPMPKPASVTVEPKTGNVVEGTFAEIEYTEAGTYEYTITEDKHGETVNGVTYDGTTWTATVKVEDDGKGHLTATTTYTSNATDSEGTTRSDVEFINKYNTGKASAEFPYKKTMLGRDFKNGDSFTFTVTAKEGTPMPKPASVTVEPKTGNVVEGTFAEIEYTKVGTYEYTITEEKAGTTENGVTYDGTIWTATVEVSDDGEGNLTATTTYTSDAKDPEGTTRGNIEFINKYHADETTESFPFQKTMTGDAITENLTFTFALTAVNPSNAPMPASNTATVTVTPENSTSAVEGAFGEIKYSAAGDYDYTIAEKAEGAEGVKYDDTVWSVHVSVKDDGNGKLVAEKTYKKDDGTEANIASFTNAYAEYDDPTIQPGVKKTLEIVGGTTVPEDLTFTFTLTDTNKDSTGMKMPEKTEIEVAATELVSNKNWTQKFGEIAFHKAGTYTFTIKETEGDNANVTYDKGTWTLTVVVAKNAENVLEITSHTLAVGDTTPETPDDLTAEFTNSYTEVETDYTPKVHKIVTGPAPEKTFNFELKAIDGAPMPADEAGAKASVQGNGDAFFGKIVYDKTGTYEYEVSEVKGDDAGFTYDETVYTLTVEVTDENGVLTATPTYTAGDITSEKLATFTNTYEAKETSYAPKIEKIIDDKNGVVPTQTFHFTLTDEAGKVSTATVTGSGTASFPAITYTKVGTHTYEVKETAGDGMGFTYDETVYTLTVDVADENGQLVAHPTYKAGELTSEELATFTNTYEAKEASYVPQVEKIVKTDFGPVPEEKTFTFTLTDEAGKVSTATVTGSGTASFPEITYDDVGTYTYEVKETAGDDAGFTYDETVYTLTVDVTDEGGQLVATPTYTAEGISSDKLATFTNTYKPAPADYTPEVEKVIKGENPPEDEVFIFNLIDSDAKVIDTVRLYGAGKTSFDPIHYEEAGTYNYSIVEVDNKTNNWTFDDTVYGLTVVVTDVDAQLTVSGVYMLNGAPVPDNGIATFTNTYTQSDTSLAIGGIKRMAGRDFQPGDTFTFTLAAQTENAPLPAQTSVTVTPASGNEVTYSFGEITYDAVASYTYQITETASNAIANVTYDTTVWTVTVDVVRNTDNTLTAVATYTSNATDGRRDGEFVNTYTIPEIEYVTLGGTKTWVDDGNSAGVRPAAIEVVLYANGVPQGNVPTWTNTDSDVWSYSFANLPATTADGTRIVYTVTETPVPLYESTQDGMNLINRLIPREEVEYTSVSGTKHWDDSDNARDVRPASVTIELLRNGEVIDQRTVSDADGWNYSFTNLPTGDGYGTAYTYEIREQMVSGYYAVYEGFDVTNVELPTPVLFSFTPGEGQIVSRQRPNFETYTEEELEDLIDLFDYGVPLYGMLLGTGDETPLYPFVFGGVGVIALAAALLIGRKKKAKAQ